MSTAPQSPSKPRPNEAADLATRMAETTRRVQAELTRAGELQQLSAQLETATEARHDGATRPNRFHQLPKVLRERCKHLTSDADLALSEWLRRIGKLVTVHDDAEAQLVLDLRRSLGGLPLRQCNSELQSATQVGDRFQQLCHKADKAARHAQAERERKSVHLNQVLAAEQERDAARREACTEGVRALHALQVASGRMNQHLTVQLVTVYQVLRAHFMEGQRMIDELSQEVDRLRQGMMEQAKELDALEKGGVTAVAKAVEAGGGVGAAGAGVAVGEDATDAGSDSDYDDDEDVAAAAQVLSGGGASADGGEVATTSDASTSTPGSALSSEATTSISEPTQARRGTSERGWAVGSAAGDVFQFELLKINTVRKPSQKKVSVDLTTGKLIELDLRRQKTKTHPMSSLLAVRKSMVNDRKIKLFWKEKKESEPERFLLKNVMERERFYETLWAARRGRSVQVDGANGEQVSIFIGSWNMGNAPAPSDLSPWIPRDKHYDLYVIGTQECEYNVNKADGTASANPSAKKGAAPAATPTGNDKKKESAAEQHWFNQLTRHLGDDYIKVVGHSLWMIRLVVFVHRDHYYKCTHVKKGTVATGIAGVAGNKGGVGVAFRFYETYLAFINSHLAARKELKRLFKRNENYQSIVSGLRLGQMVDELDITMGFSHLFWLGDLNYRLDLSRDLVVQLVEANQLETLYKNDQLVSQMAANRAFSGWAEKRPEFRPTYRYNRGDRTYSEEKMRVPAWCDRVLWRSLPGLADDLELTEWDCSDEVMTSDHSPVYATFNVRVDHPNTPQAQPGCQVRVVDLKVDVSPTAEASFVQGNFKTSASLASALSGESMSNGGSLGGGEGATGSIGAGVALSATASTPAKTIPLTQPAGGDASGSGDAGGSVSSTQSLDSDESGTGGGGSNPAVVVGSPPPERAPNMAAPSADLYVEFAAPFLRASKSSTVARRTLQPEWEDSALPALQPITTNLSFLQRQHVFMAVRDNAHAGDVVAAGVVDLRRALETEPGAGPNWGDKVYSAPFDLPLLNRGRHVGRMVGRINVEYVQTQAGPTSSFSMARSSGRRGSSASVSSIALGSRRTGGSTGGSSSSSSTSSGLASAGSDGEGGRAGSSDSRAAAVAARVAAAVGVGSGASSGRVASGASAAGGSPQFNVLKSGYLMKLGAKRKNWKRRYFELTVSGELSYYQDRGQAAPIDRVNIKGAPVSSDTKSGKAHAMAVQTKSRRYVFYADSEEEKIEWIQALSIFSDRERD